MARALSQRVIAQNRDFGNSCHTSLVRSEQNVPRGIRTCAANDFLAYIFQRIFVVQCGKHADETSTVVLV